MDEELKTYLTELKREMTEMKIGLADMKSELIQHTEAVKTRLLGEFWTWTRTADNTLPASKLGCWFPQ